MAAPDYSPARALMRAARQHPDRDSIIWSEPGRVWSVAESADAVRRTAARLRDLGIGPGDRVVLVAANTPWCFLLHLACSWVGAATVPLSERLPAPVVRELLGLVEPRLVLVDEDGPVPGTPIGAFAEAALRTGPIGGEPPARDGETAAIVFTSGSSGRTRGVELTHAQLWWGSMCFRDGFEYSPAEEVLGVCAPLSHIGGFNGTSIDVFSHGGAILVFPSFDAGRVLRAVEEHRITMMFVVPAMCHLLLDANRRLGADLGSWARPLVGGDLLGPELAGRMLEAGLRPIHVWGMTETSGAGLMASPDCGAPPGSLGAPFPHIDVRLVGEDGRPSPAGAIGEIQVRGPSLASSFLPLREGGAPGPGGWLSTGDLALQDEQGWFRMVSRKSRMMNTGGELVAPAPLEELLRALPAVEDACVVGIPDARWGERIGALLVPAEGAGGLDAGAVARGVDGMLAPWERIRVASWAEAIPALPNGKPDAAGARRILMGLHGASS